MGKADRQFKSIRDIMAMDIRIIRGELRSKKFPSFGERKAFLEGCIRTHRLLADRMSLYRL